jgi:competence protein ComEC
MAPGLAVCLVAGVAVGLLTDAALTDAVAAVLALGSLAILPDARTLRWVLGLAALAAGGAAHGAFARDRAVAPPIVEWLDRTADASARVLDPVLVRGRIVADAGRTDFGVRLVIDVREIREAGWRAAPGRIQVYVAGELAASRMADWTAGREVSAPVSLRRPQVLQNPGGSSERLLRLRRPFLLAGSVKSAALIAVEPAAWWHEGAAAVRRHVRDSVSRHFHRETHAAVVTAILIGDRAGLSDEIERRLQAAGTYHVIAISGGNVALLVVLTIGAVRLAVRPHRAALCLALAIVLAYGWVVGGDSSVQRAVAAAAIYLAARLAGLVPRAVYVIATVAMLIVAIDPVAVVDVGAWLSFGATLAIVLHANDLGSLFGRSKRLPRSILGATLAAELAVMPIGATVFSRVTIAGFVLNFIAIPAMAVVQLSGLLSSVLDLLWTAAAARIASPGDMAAKWLLHSAGLVDTAPWLSWRVPPVHTGWIALYYIAWAMVLSPRGPRRLRLVSAGAALVATIVVMTAPNLAATRLPDTNLRVAVLDVGQGDAIALRFPSGESLLVDTGGSPGPFDIGGRVVTPALWALGIRGLDWLAITHADLDHIGGARAVLSDLGPREVWEGVPVPRSREMQTLRADARRAGTIWRRLQAGDRLEIGEVLLEVLHPPPPDWERQKIRNDDSLVLRVVYGRVEFLLTGDVGAEFERRSWDERETSMVRVLKVAHHGSRTSSSTGFVAAYRPDIALISAGRGNLFGHPAPEVLERLSVAGAEIFRTDRDAAIIVDTDGRRVSVRTMHGRDYEVRASTRPNPAHPSSGDPTPDRWRAGPLGPALDLRPRSLELLQRRPMHRSALPFEPLFQCVEATCELVVGGAERRLRFDPELAGEVGDGEEKIAELLGGAGRAFGQRGAKLADLLVHLVDHVGGVRPVEADGGHTTADLVRALERGQRPRHAFEHAPGGSGARLLAGLDDFPLFLDGRRRPNGARAPRLRRQRPAGRREDVGMAADELLGDRVDGVADVEAPVFGRDLRVEDALKQHVAELGGQRVEVAAVDRLDGLVGLFEQVWTQ